MSWGFLLGVGMGLGLGLGPASTHHSTLHTTHSTQHIALSTQHPTPSTTHATLDFPKVSFRLTWDLRGHPVDSSGAWAWAWPWAWVRHGSRHQSKQHHHSTQQLLRFRMPLESLENCFELPTGVPLDCFQTSFRFPFDFHWVSCGLP